MSTFLWQRSDAAPWDAGYELARTLDRFASAILLAFALAIACSWALALAHALTAPALLGCAVIALVAGSIGLYTKRRLFVTELDLPRATVLTVLAGLCPLAFWLAFVAWRGSVVPVYNHDALAYHFPKAVLMMKAHGFEFFAPAHEPRISMWPIDYELLLADAMLLSGTDAFTAAISNLSYVLFLLFAARTAAAFWGGGVHVLVVVLLTAAAPIVVLHSGLHKNDLLFASCCLGASGWAARWFVRRCVPSFVLSVVALLLCIGLKVSGAFVFVVVAPALLWGLWRARSGLTMRFFAWLAGGAFLGAILVGGAFVFVANLSAVGRLTQGPELAASGYGDFGNIWKFTYLLLAKPFSQSGWVWLPWRREEWWWPSNDIWCSHVGGAVTVAALFLGPCIWRYRGQGPGRERAVQSLIVAAIYALTLPLHSVPDGFFNTNVRYIVYVVPVVLAWTAGPVLLELERRLGRFGAVGSGIAVVAAVLAFVSSSWTFGANDAYTPLEFLTYQLAHPDNRLPWTRQNRAALVFDRGAPPDAVCAFDVGFDTWIYPAWGANLTREVQFLPRSEGPVPIDDRVQFVLVDRSWNVFFGHPAFTDMGKARRYLGQGKPSDADTKVFTQLRADPRFELVYDDRPQNQAIFRRK